MAKKENKSENKVKKHFFKDFKAELKKVIWPTPKQLVNNTVAVVTIVIITGAIVFGLDSMFDLGNKYGITKLQNIVDEKFGKDEESENSSSEESSSEDSESSEDGNEEGTTESSEENTAGEESSTTENTETPTENSEQ